MLQNNAITEKLLNVINYKVSAWSDMVPFLCCQIILRKALMQDNLKRNLFSANHPWIIELFILKWNRSFLPYKYKNNLQWCINKNIKAHIFGS